MKNFIEALVFVLFGLREHRWWSFMRAMQTGLVAFALGGCTSSILLVSGVSPRDAQILAMLFVLVAMIAFYHFLTSDKFIGRAFLYGFGCSLMFWGGKVMGNELPDEYGLTVQWVNTFGPGLWLVFRAFADGKTGITL